MIESPMPVDDGWDRGWEEHKVRQLLRIAKLPFSEKLAWLESAQRFVDALRKASSTASKGENPTDCPPDTT